MHQRNKEITKDFLKSSVTNPEGVKAMLAADFVAHLPSGPKGQEGFLQQLDYFGAAFHDQEFVIRDIISEGDEVVIYADWQGTHTGEFMGYPPTGKKITISAFTLDRLRDGKIVEHRSLFDMLSMMQQLGENSNA
jgi:steroid delta-isomerase-like uncharacterized protein